jgi:hypothetical protein
MYWLRAEKLADDFREGRVDEKERFKYYVATFIAWNLIAQLFLAYGGPFQPMRLIPMALNLIVTVAAAFLCYRVNKTGDNTDFIARMICLGWPIGIRTIIGSVVLASIILVATIPLPRQTTLSEAFGGFLRWWLFSLILGYYSQFFLCLPRCARAEIVHVEFRL